MPPTESSAAGVRASSAGRDRQTRLARQRARAGKRDRARGNPVRRGDHHRRAVGDRLAAVNAGRDQRARERGDVWKPRRIFPEICARAPAPIERDRAREAPWYQPQGALGKAAPARNSQAEAAGVEGLRGKFRKSKVESLKSKGTSLQRSSALKLSTFNF